jgi:tetratricopeptide (TPR) repeat protein
LSGTRVALVLVLGAGAATSFYRLGVHSLWYDEITGARVADLRSEAGILAAHKMDSHPPATALAEYWSRRAFGLSEWSLRLPAALASVASLVFIFAIAASSGDARIGCLAAGLAAFAPSFVYFAHDARPYALAMFFSAAATACFLFAFRGGRKYVWFPPYAVFAGLAFYSHYFAAIVIATHFVVAALGWLPAFRPRAAVSSRRYAVVFVLFAVAACAAVAAAWPVFSEALYDRGRFPGGEMAVTPSLVWGSLMVAGWDRAAANVLFLGAWAAGITAIWRRAGAFAGTAALALVALPALLPVAVIRLTTQYWNPRFSYFAFPAAMAVAAFGFAASAKWLAAASRKRFGAAALTAVLAAGAALAIADDVVALRARYTMPEQDFRGAVSLVNRNRNWQTKVLVWPYRNHDCFLYYTKTQGGPGAMAKPRTGVYKTLERWPRVFIVCTDGEFTGELMRRFPTMVQFRLRSVDVLYHNSSYKKPGQLYGRLPGELVGVPPAVMANALGRRALLSGHKKRALEFFEKASAYERRDEVATFDLANLYAQRGEYERALRLVGGYVRRHPHESWPYTRLAETYFRSGDKNSAAAYYRRALWLEPSKDSWRTRLKDMVFNRPFFRGFFGYSDPRWM